MLSIHWHEASTKRGAVLCVGSMIALVFLWFRDPTAALTVLAIAKFFAGGLGVVLPDVPDQPK